MDRLFLDANTAFCVVLMYRQCIYSLCILGIYKEGYEGPGNEMG
jgi:hypothetical protein